MYLLPKWSQLSPFHTTHHSWFAPPLTLGLRSFSKTRHRKDRQSSSLNCSWLAYLQRTAVNSLSQLWKGISLYAASGLELAYISFLFESHFAFIKRTRLITIKAKILSSCIFHIVSRCHYWDYCVTRYVVTWAWILATCYTPVHSA